jgi:hypothetical protein
MHESLKQFTQDEYSHNGGSRAMSRTYDSRGIVITPEMVGSAELPLSNIVSAAKNDQTKPDLSLLPKIFMEETARAFMVGEKKYTRYNYCKGHKASQLVAAAQRHLAAWFQGEEHDPVDGQHHLGSVAACVAMLLRQQELGTLQDNRFKDGR